MVRSGTTHRLSLNPSFQTGGRVDELVTDGLLHQECERIFRVKDEAGVGDILTFHQHQRDAIALARTSLQLRRHLPRPRRRILRSQS